METESNLKTEIFLILDEILDINQRIILRNDQGLTKETLQGLRLYKNGLDLFLAKITMITDKNENNNFINPTIKCKSSSKKSIRPNISDFGQMDD